MRDIVLRISKCRNVSISAQPRIEKGGLVMLQQMPSVFPTRTRILSFLALLFFGGSMSFLGATRAFFSDDDSLRAQKISAGNWIPNVLVKKEKRCFRLASSIPEAVLYYEFSHDGDPRDSGRISDGSCIAIPWDTFRREKNIPLQAQAFYPGHDEWKSGVLREEFHRKRDDRGAEHHDEIEEHHEGEDQRARGEGVHDESIVEIHDLNHEESSRGAISIPHEGEIESENEDVSSDLSVGLGGTSVDIHEQERRDESRDIVPNIDK